MGVEIRERVRMMHALRAAFENERLFVVYQPQIDMRTGNAIGAEALLRWKTEDGQFVPPDQFIPIAEYSGLIVDIGEWVLRSACFELLELHKLGFSDFKMAVNVSQAQFSHPLFLQSLERALQDTKAPANCVELEITESMAMTDPELLIQTLQHIQHLGAQVSIDDFGTGFSSLSHLQKLNVDKLKIDRAFVNEIGDKSSEGSIAKMIVQLSQSLNIKVIAEGVETQQQAETLMSYGCHFAQGYLYAKPLTKLDLRNWLSSH
ncbi:putative bifunctional diguanylate cyclase/phosphodiesterase [Undibacterium fentianense]